MDGHAPTLERPGGQYQIFCQCARWKSMIQPFSWQVSDAHDQHVEQVARARASLSRKSVPLKASLKWYRECQADEARPAAERERWRVLADELETRITPTTDDGQLPLF